MKTNVVVNGTVIRDPASGRLLRIDVAPSDWQALGVGAGDRVLLETRDGDTCAAELELDEHGQLAIRIASDLGVHARMVRVRRPRSAP